MLTSGPKKVGSTWESDFYLSEDTSICKTKTFLQEASAAELAIANEYYLLRQLWDLIVLGGC